MATETKAAALEIGRTAATQYVNLSEQAFNGLADLQEQLAQSTRVDWIAAVGGAQANLTRELTAAYTRAARELVK